MAISYHSLNDLNVYGNDQQTISSNEDMEGTAECQNSTNIRELFPGPAGFINFDKISNQNTLSTKKCNSLNMENMNCWNQFLDNLQVKKLWKSSRSNLKAIKSNMIEVKFHLKVPILIVAIKKILELDSTSSSDIFCVMQDPTDEVKAQMHSDVITDYGKLIRVGNIFLLQSPTIFVMNTYNYIAVTKKNICAIFSSQSDEFFRFHPFNQKDLESWLSSTVDDYTCLTERITTTEKISNNETIKSVCNTSMNEFSLGISETPNRVKTFSNSEKDSSDIFEDHATTTNNEASRITSNIRQDSTGHISMESPTENDFLSRFLEGIDTDLLFDEF